MSILPSNLFPKNGTIIMAGSRVGRDLYELDISTANSSQNDALVCSAVANREPISIWHQRLSHTSYKTFIKMVSNGLVDGIKLKDISTPSIICPGCAFGKMHRLPFKSGRRRATQVGEITQSVKNLMNGSQKNQSATKLVLHIPLNKMAFQNENIIQLEKWNGARCT
jgi:hypothetical protein